MEFLGLVCVDGFDFKHFMVDSTSDIGMDRFSVYTLKSDNDGIISYAYTVEDSKSSDSRCCIEGFVDNLNSIKESSIESIKMALDETYFGFSKDELLMIYVENIVKEKAKDLINKNGSDFNLVTHRINSVIVFYTDIIIVENQEIFENNPELSDEFKKLKTNINKFKISLNPVTQSVLREIIIKRLAYIFLKLNNNIV